MIKETEMTEKYIRYKLKRNTSGTINPRGFNEFTYKGETLLINKNLKSNHYYINIFKQGNLLNEGEYKTLSTTFNHDELKEFYNIIGKILEK